MRKSLLICTSLTALTLATGTAFAQNERTAPGGAGGGPSMEAAPPSGGAGPASRMERGAGGEGNSARERSDPYPSLRERGTRPEAQDRTEERSGPSRKSAGAEKSGKGEHDGSAASGASEGTAGRSAAKSEEKAGKRDSAASGASEGTAGADRDTAKSLTQLSGEKRTKVQSAFRSHRSGAVVKDVDINVSIGVAVPHSVTLYAVPEDVIVLMPAYRRYKYFIYDDKVLIVDPVSYEIIDVLILA